MRRGAAGPSPARATFREFLETVSNEWTRASFERANEPGYIDDLLEIYKTRVNSERAMPETEWQEISAAYDARDDVALLEALFRQPVFPVKGHEVSLLRSCAGGYLSTNMRAVRSLAGKVYAMDKDDLRSACEAPAATSRQLSQDFRNWLIGTFEVKDAEAFLAHAEGICVLDGGDEELGSFAKEHLGYTYDKGLDGIIKVDRTYFPIEAKLMSASGGGQDRQLEEAVGIHKRGFAEGVEPLAVVDGQHLMLSPASLENPQRKLSFGRYRRLIADSEGPVISALLLEEMVAERRAASAAA